MKHKLISILCISIIIPLLFSCTLPDQYLSTWGKLKYKAKMDSKIIKGIEVAEVLNFNDIEGAGVVDVYICWNWVRTSNSMGNAIDRTGMTNVKYSLFALAFESGRLIYWGFPEDFLRSDDPKIRRIGEKTCDKLIEDL